MMCGVCGCAKGLEREHEHGHGHGHGAEIQTRPTSTIKIERALLSKNQQFAEQNRAWLAERSCLAINLMGSPGAGKTALLEAVVRLMPELPLLVIEGDQATERD